MKSIHPFLENEIRYQIQMLDYLYIKETHWVSIKELADEVKLKSRAILKYISSINDVIKVQYAGKLFLDMQGNQSFRLIINENKFFLNFGWKL
ncbi:hypothetical protein GIX45_16680 [Erwinia sp. CPCC 100877]|nr:hypothetical protein [Erwinia sp. CPCC 100877]